MKQILSTFLLALLATLALRAQPSNDDIVNAAGTAYVIAYPDTTMNTFDARFPNTRHPDKAYIWIYSAVDNRVQIRGAGFNKTELLQAGKFTIVDLMDPVARASQPIVTRSNAVSQATFRLEADQPIVVYCYLLTRFGTEAWTPIPVESWGTEYFVAARPGEIANDVSPGGEFDYNKKSKMAPAEITIVAAFDNTYITIQPTGALYDSARTTSIRLQAGDVYQVQSYVDTSVYADIQPDLGGTRVTATKPIGVISGNTRSQVLYFQEGLGQNIFKNMLIEWLPPVGQHGTEFVYMPTWDARRPTGVPGEDLSSKRKGEHVRIYATSSGATTGYSLDSSIGRLDFTISGPGKFHEDYIGDPVARYYRTSRPAQAMMNSTAIVRYNGTTQGFGGYIGAQFDGYGAYMVEMVPRSQWSSFTPYYASGQPSGMEHFINVVTDSAHRFDVFQENGSRFSFNRGSIPGTDLVWGTMAVTTSKDHYLQGRNGARFSGHVYGLYRGHEEYRPGGAKKERDAEGESARSGGGEEGEPLHPSEYEEYLAVAYGYPLAANHLINAPADSLKIDTVIGCGMMTIRITALNPNPSGLKTVRLDSAMNVRFLSVAPSPLVGASIATVVVAPITLAQEAGAIIVIQDRTGRITRLRYSYSPERVVVDPATKVSSFGTVNPGTTTTRDIIFTNPTESPIEVRDVQLLDTTGIFSIVSTTPGPLPVSLAKGASLRVTVQAQPTRENRTYVDSLRVTFGCISETVAVTVATSAPRIEVDDIDFGRIDTGSTVTRSMRICNRGSGTVEFSQGPGGGFIEWLNRQAFTVTAAEMEKLRTAKLPADSCIEIAVTFMARAEGIFSDTARFYPNTPLTKSYSYWRAEVVGGTVGVTGEERISGAVMVHPNPVSGTTSFSFHLERPAIVRLVVVDASGREVGMMERTLAAGDRSLLWDATSVAAGVYFYRLAVGGAVSSGSVVVVR